jgi:hypothetical protein
VYLPERIYNNISNWSLFGPDLNGSCIRSEHSSSDLKACDDQMIGIEKPIVILLGLSKFEIKKGKRLIEIDYSSDDRSRTTIQVTRARTPRATPHNP